MATKRDIEQECGRSELAALVAEVTEALAAGAKVTYRGFGTFTVARSDDHTVVSGERQMTFQRVRRPVFRADPVLKDAIGAGAVLTPLRPALAAIRTHLMGRQEVRLGGFGTFAVVIQQGFTGQNPKDGTPHSVPERVVVTFRAGRDLNEAMTSESPEE